MLVNEKLSQMEFTFIALHRAWSLIDNIVNYELLTKHESDYSCNLRFTSHSSFHLFYILVLEFNKDMGGCICKKKTNFANALLDGSIADYCNSNNQWAILSNSIREYEYFLDSTCSKTFYINNNNCTAKFTIRDALYVFSNRFKHDPTTLGHCANKMKSWFENLHLESEHGIFAIFDELYAQHFYSLMIQSSSVVAYYLNNVRINIYHYLSSEFTRSYRRLDEIAYEYNIPNDIRNIYARDCYWELMNKVRSGLYFKPLTLCKLTKKIWFADHGITLV